MCGRYSLMTELAALAEELNLLVLPPRFEPRDQVTPGSGIAILIDAKRRKLEYFYWGLVPSWAKDVSIARKTFNARAETLLERASFRNAFRRRRALIPATSYYEWTSEGGTKTPYRFFLPDTKIFTFAGLWDYWMDAEGNEVYSATMITTAANEIAARVHSRMPVIIDRKDRDRWLTCDDPREVSDLLRPIAPERMTIERAEIERAPSLQGSELRLL
ncbi:hypothetical protein BEQ56_09800 [Anaerolineaceae bacterium oral taxon 439]|nr:hypothetical protein BEQ56_09800 [Anaerolineaceae bacterium oral taxon 439]